MENKVCLITGASRGIGVGIAECMSRAGWKRLALVARNGENLEKVAAACKELGAKEVLTLAKDLSDLEACVQAVQETAKHFGSMLFMFGCSGYSLVQLELNCRIGCPGQQCRQV